jgi:pimeloyl-ACP methyl ester carboxylesterase
VAAGDVGIVLVAGAGLGSWTWERVLSRLRTPALAVDIPGRAARPADRRTVTLDTIADAVAADIEAARWQRVVLVAHSLAGVMAPAIASRASGRVAEIVFIAAEVPAEGERALDLISAPLRLLLRVMWTIRPTGIRPPPAAIRRALCNDLDDATTAMVVERMEPEAPGIYRSRVSWAGVPVVPRVYVKCLQDQSDISADRQDVMAARLATDRVVSLDTGHLPMLARPEEVAAVLDEAATRAS